MRSIPRTILILAVLVAGSVAATVYMQNKSSESLAIKAEPLSEPSESTAPEPVPPEPTQLPPQDEISFSGQTSEVAYKPTNTVLSLIKKMRVASQSPPISAPPAPPPLPETPFLNPDTPAETVPVPPSKTEVSIEPKHHSLDWFQFEVGPSTISQKQEDTLYSETRSVTNPLSLLIALGISLSENLGLDFSWAQPIGVTASKKNKLPKNRLTAGLNWQPSALVGKSSFWRWSLGIALEDATYFDGDPASSKLTNYTKQDLYGGVQYNTALASLWFLDLKVLLSMTPLKPSTFESYTESGMLLMITPQYEISENLRLGLSLEYQMKQRQAGITNYLNQKDSSMIELQEFRTAISVIYNF